MHIITRKRVNDFAEKHSDTKSALQRCGDAYARLLNDIFAYYFPNAFQGFNRTGEQVDGQFYSDGHWYFIEIRWRKEPASAADVSVLRDRTRSGFAGDVRAVFVSYNGFSPECLDSLEASGERVILLTGYDVRSVLECDIALDVLLHRIQAFLVKNKKRISVPAKSSECSSQNGVLANKGANYDDRSNHRLF